MRNLPSGGFTQQEKVPVLFHSRGLAVQEEVVVVVGEEEGGGVGLSE